MQERRRFQRGTTYLGGVVAFNNRCSTMDCLVRNMSQNGARIVFPSTVAVPSEFDITIRHKGDSRRARIAWRTERQAGIEFLDSEGAAVVSIETARKLRALAEERTVLERRIAQLTEPV